MRLSIAKKILNIADELDKLGLYSEANDLTNLVRTAQMPGGANPAAGYAQPAPQAPPITDQALQQQQPKQNWQAEINKLTGGIPSPASAANYPLTPPTTYNGPQRPYDPRYDAQTYPQQAGGYRGWYQQNQTPVVNTPTYDVQGMQKQLMNMPVSPFTVVKDGVVQKGATMQDMMNNAVKSVQNQQTGVNANQTVENARQLQIQNEMAEAQERYWRLWQEQQNQAAGDGHPELYK